MRREGSVLDSTALQHFFGLYPELAGMTATARPQEEELLENYGLSVVVLPTHHPCKRLDPLNTFYRAADTAFQERLDGLDAAVAGLVALHAGGEELLGPSSTWTYLIDDDPFREALGLHVSGNLALSLGAAIYSPLYMGAAQWRRLRRKRRTPR